MAPKWQGQDLNPGNPVRAPGALTTVQTYQYVDICHFCVPYEPLWVCHSWVTASKSLWSCAHIVPVPPLRALSTALVDLLSGACFYAQASRCSTARFRHWGATTRSHHPSLGRPGFVSLGLRPCLLGLSSAHNPCSFCSLVAPLRVLICRTAYSGPRCEIIMIINFVQGFE